MSEWQTVKLGDVITLKRGYDLPERDRIPGDVPIVSSSGISGYHNEAKVKAPGVVTGRYGTLGEIYYLTDDFWPHNTTLYVKDFKGNHPQFISYFLRSIGLASQSGAAAVPGVNRNHLHMIQVSVPDPQTQRRIAAILSAYDDLIENNTRRIQALEQAAHDLYREWFVEFRFPGHESVPLVDSGTEYGMIPQGWGVVKLDEVADVNALSIRNGDIPAEIEYVDISSVSTGRIDDTQIIPFEDAPGRARRIVRHGDTIWATVRPNRRSYALILRPSENLIVSTGFAVISPSKVPYSYLYKSITTDAFAEYLTNHATGSAYPAVNANDFKSAAILVPSANIAEEFHSIVADFYDEKAILEQKNNALREARDLLLPRLVSGELSVEDVPHP